jgi:ceramide glucosyltransferase
MQIILHFMHLIWIWHFAIAIWILAIAVVFFGTFRALFTLKKPNAPRMILPDAELPPLSILKPLKGIDENLELNIESFLRSNYPEFEILFSVADLDDPAIGLVERLIQKYPNVQARLYIGASKIGRNPKINNIFRSYKEALHDTILISDSNTRVGADYLRRIASQFGPDIAMQSSVVFGGHPLGLGGMLEATFIRIMLAVEALGHPCTMGKAMMFRKSVFERVCGFSAISNDIAEDYEAGHRLHLMGLKVQTTHDPIEQYIGKYSIGNFWSRHVRWGRIRKLKAPLPFCAEFLVGAVPSGLIGAMAFSGEFDFPPLVFLFLHMTFWFLCDSMILSRVGQKFTWATAPVWLLREILSLPLWLHISIGNSIQWRGRTIQLGLGAVIEDEPEPETEPEVVASGGVEKCSSI